MILPLDHRPALRTALRQLARGILAFYAHAYSPPRRPPGLGLGATLVLGFAAVAVISVLAMATGAPILAIGIANGARLVVREVRSDRAKRAAAPARAFTRSPDPIQVYGAAWSQAFLESRSLDRSRAESGADLLYRAAHQPPPALRIWTRSPRELFIAESLIQTMLDAVGQGVETTAAWEQALAEHQPDHADPAWAITVAHVGSQILAQTPLAPSVTRLSPADPESRLTDSPSLPIQNGIGKALHRTRAQRIAVMSQLRFEGRPEASEWVSRVGVARSHGMAHLAWHEYLRDTAGRAMPAEWSALGTMIRACDGWLLVRGAALFLEPPLRTVEDDQGRFHSDAGPAIVYADGFAVWAQHDVTLPRVAVESPADLTIDLLRASVFEDFERERQLIRIYGEARYRTEASATLDLIAAEPMPGMRRQLVEAYGVGRYATAVGEVIATDVDGLGQARRLWRVRRPNDDLMVLVEVANSTPEADGSREAFWLRVPPHISTCQGAVAWTFGVNEGEYRPLVET